MTRIYLTMAIIVSATIAFTNELPPHSTKEYISEVGNFQLLYPHNWKVKEKTIKKEINVTFLPPIKSLLPISFLIRDNAWPDEEFACPMGMIHVVDCKEVLNPLGEKYVRVVFTGLLPDKDHQYLRVFFRPKGSLVDVEADMELTDKKGKPLISAESTEPVFNQMIESFRSFDANGNTAQQGGPADAGTGGPRR